MLRLPVIVGFGGYNAAGRASFHQAFRRMVIESLPADQRQETLLGLATLMNIVRYDGGQYRDRNGSLFSAEEVCQEFGHSILDDTLVRFLEEPASPYTDNFYEKIAVRSAGQLPGGFVPGDYYRSQCHPKGLQMAVMGASDAVHSLGLPWHQIMQSVAPDQVSVYSSSAMAQMDENGYQGLMQARMNGRKVTAKQLPLGLNSMPTDFINAYVLGSVGSTGSMTGACASFLYNLRLGIEDIQSGRARVVLVGNSEAPLTREIIDGYSAMSALATEAGLKKLDGNGRADYRRACRPFSDNCGFTLAESAQYFVLMDDALAMALGMQIHGAVTDVFVNADGNKRSISAPGAGNYLTLAKSVAAARSMLGDEAIQKRSWVQSHGSSTPQNRVTESAILDRVASAFGITEWPVTAIKSYVGHSLAPASGDQLAATLGSFAQGILPGIKTIDHVASDVMAERLKISFSDLTAKKDVAFINSKGFGGNNASAVVLSPDVVSAMLGKRYGKSAMVEYAKRNDTVTEQASAYHQQALRGELNPVYRFGEDVIDDDGITVTSSSITLAGFDHPVSLIRDNPYQDMF